MKTNAEKLADYLQSRYGLMLPPPCRAELIAKIDEIMMPPPASAAVAVEPQKPKKSRRKTDAA